MLNTFESNELQSNNAYATYYVNNLTSNILAPLTGMLYTYTKYGDRFIITYEFAFPPIIYVRRKVKLLFQIRKNKRLSCL